MLLPWKLGRPKRNSENDSHVLMISDRENMNIDYFNLNNIKSRYKFLKFENNLTLNIADLLNQNSLNTGFQLM